MTFFSKKPYLLSSSSENLTKSESFNKKAALVSIIFFTTGIISAGILIASHKGLCKLKDYQFKLLLGVIGLSEGLSLLFFLQAIMPQAAKQQNVLKSTPSLVKSKKKPENIFKKEKTQELLNLLKQELDSNKENENTVQTSESLIFEKIKTLILEGADPAGENEFGETALSLALLCSENGAETTYLEIVDFLLTKGANPYAKKAVRGSFRTQGDDISLWEDILTRNNKKMVEIFIKNKVDCNSKFFHKAPRTFGDYSSSDKELGANSGNIPEYKSIPNFSTPLEILFYGSPPEEDLIKLLIEKGADSKAVTSKGETILHQAIQRNCSLNLIKLLIEKGANINAQTYVYLETPLHLAVQNQNLEIVKFLLNQGASCTIKDAREWTPLVLAEKLPNKEIETLLKNSPNA